MWPSNEQKIIEEVAKENDISVEEAKEIINSLFTSISKSRKNINIKMFKIFKFGTIRQKGYKAEHGNRKKKAPSRRFQNNI